MYLKHSYRNLLSVTLHSLHIEDNIKYDFVLMNQEFTFHIVTFEETIYYFMIFFIIKMNKYI